MQQTVMVYRYFKALSRGASPLPLSELEKFMFLSQDGYGYINLTKIQPRDVINFSTYWRRKIAREFCFPVPSLEMVEELRKLSPLVEIGAGSGFLARILTNAGADIVATDTRTGRYGQRVGLWYRTELMNASTALMRYNDRNVLCAWPCFRRPWAEKALRKMHQNRVMAYVGEWEGGCTATDGFFELVDNKFEQLIVPIPSWDYIHDNMFLLARRNLTYGH